MECSALISFSDFSERRLASLFAQLPTVQSVLEIGSGSDPISAEYFPGVTRVDLDSDWHALNRAKPKHPTIHFLQADGRHLPFAHPFDLMMVRHPDIDKYPDAWAAVFRRAIHFCRALLVVTTYSAHEIEQVRGWLSCPELEPYPLDLTQLAPPSLVGSDRYILALQIVKLSNVAAIE